MIFWGRVEEHLNTDRTQPYVRDTLRGAYHLRGGYEEGRRGIFGSYLHNYLGLNSRLVQVDISCLFGRVDEFTALAG
jgi:hypothetical protein